MRTPAAPECSPSIIAPLFGTADASLRLPEAGISPGESVRTPAPGENLRYTSMTQADRGSSIERRNRSTRWELPCSIAPFTGKGMGSWNLRLERSPSSRERRVGLGWRSPSGLLGPGSTSCWLTSKSRLSQRRRRDPSAGRGGAGGAHRRRATPRRLRRWRVRRSNGSARYTWCATTPGWPASPDPWFGPLSAWKWVVGVNLWGVIHGIRSLPADPYEPR